MSNIRYSSPPQREFGKYWISIVENEDFDDQPFLSDYSYIEGNDFVDHKMIGRVRDCGWDFSKIRTEEFFFDIDSKNYNDLKDIKIKILSAPLTFENRPLPFSNKDYVDAVNAGNFPYDIIVPLDKPFVDDRGIIQNVWLGNSGSITYIESVKGAVRAQHLHTIESGDFHSIFIISGSLKYTEGKNLEAKEYIFKAGQSFFTRPGVFHTVEFLEHTKMITINGIVKNHENYEKSIERLK